MARNTLQKEREYRYIQKCFEKETKHMREVNRRRREKGRKIIYTDVYAQAIEKMEDKYNIFKSDRALKFIIFREYERQKVNHKGEQLPEQIGKGRNEEHIKKVLEARKKIDTNIKNLQKM